MWALILNISFIGEVPTSYAPPPPLIVFSEKHKYIFNLENNHVIISCCTSDSLYLSGLKLFYPTRLLGHISRYIYISFCGGVVFHHYHCIFHWESLDSSRNLGVHWGSFQTSQVPAWVAASATCAGSQTLWYQGYFIQVVICYSRNVGSG